MTPLPKNRSMIRTYTMRLKVTRKQDATLDAMLWECYELYNAALGERISAWKTCRKSITYQDQQAELTQLRAQYDHEASFPVAIQRDPLRRVDRAFKAFFRRCKSGEKPGFPRFRSRNRYDSFSVSGGNFRLAEHSVIVSKIGILKIKTHCKIKGAPIELRVKRVGNKWQAQVVCDIGPAPEKVAVHRAVGIDLGLTSLATMSDGKVIQNPRWTRQEDDRLAESNCSLARKKRGSKNRAKAKERLRRVHQRIAGRRASYLTGVAKQLVSTYDLIAHEDLKIRNMVRSNLAKSILDAAWRQLIWRIQCEAEYAGKWVIPVNPKNTTQLCSGCGEKVPKGLGDRWHECPKCGLSLDRDHNAALNVLRLGESLAETQNCILSVYEFTRQDHGE